MKRDSRLTADITEDAHNMLIALTKKHERGKGFFIEKMIRKFCVDASVEDKSKQIKFTPPKMQEVFNYCNERCNNVNAQKFVDFYESKNWMVGKNKMKSWKASVRTWEQKDQPKNKVDDNFETIKGWINE